MWTNILIFTKLHVMDKKNTDNKDKHQVEVKALWTKPSIKNLGNAKEIVANVNVTGGGDAQFSVLNPS